MSFHALRFLTESSKVNWMEATRSSFLIEKDEGEGMHQPFAKFFLRTTDNSVLLPWRKRVGLLLFAMLQNGLTGGVLFGWASIDKTMLTTPGGKGSGLSFHETTLIFSWASCVAMVSSLILGVVLDCYGPRICSIVSSLIIAIGCQVFALSRSFSGLAFGACLIAFGGPGITSSIIHIANIFPGTEYLVMSCLSGSIALSFSVFAVFDAIWARFESVTFRTLFSSFSLIVVGLAIGAFLIYPDEPFGEFEEDLLDEKEKLPLTNESVTIPPSPTTILYNHHLERNNETCEGSTSYGQAHHDHIKSVAPASLKVEQPLNSFLRDSSKILQKTESFFASKTALGGGADVDVTIISLKDKPFYQQLISTSYFRSSSVFLVTSFVTNFYVASISTEVSLLEVFFRFFRSTLRNISNMLDSGTACRLARL